MNDDRPDRLEIEEGYVAIPTEEGPMRAFAARPRATFSSGDDVPGVIMVQHIGGLSETMVVVAQRVAQLGVLCVVPALYHRLGDIVVDPTASEPAVAQIRAIAVASVTPERLLADMRAALGWLRSSGRARPGPCGIIGFGGGAGQAMRVACQLPGEFAAFIGILGVGYVRPGDAASPHLGLGAFSGAGYFGFAGDDDIIPMADVERLRAVLAAAAVDHEIAVHPGVGHGYLFSNRPAYARAAAEEDWDRVGALFARKLAGARSSKE